MSRFIFVALVLMAVTTWSSRGQDRLTENTLQLSGEAMPEATVDQAAWLAGAWSGAAMNGTAIEVWTPPSGESMIGLFKYVEEGETVFSEIMTIIPTGSSITMRLKHFSADLTGWEEKNEYQDFPLVKLDPDRLFFDGLTVQKTGANTITIYVATENEDGTFSELKFPYSRIRL